MTLSATAEGLVIGKAYGLDPAAMVEVMNVSTGHVVDQPDAHPEPRAQPRVR